MENFIYHNSQLSEWSLPDTVWQCLSPYERSFFDIEFKHDNSLKYYTERLRALGFAAHDNVLDAGCGMGQWSIAMSRLNKAVSGVDINIGRLLIAERLCKEMNIHNAQFQYSSLEQLPFPNRCLDAVFCYGVFMFTHMPTAMTEFSRVLRPGGILYCNANSLGWYFHLLFDLGFKQKQRRMVATACKMILKTILGYRRNVMVSPKGLARLLKNHGFDITGIGPEGSIGCFKNFKSRSKYPPTYYGQPAITEALAIRR